jgi:hypothetical protein
MLYAKMEIGQQDNIGIRDISICLLPGILVLEEIGRRAVFGWPEERTAGA